MQSGLVLAASRSSKAANAAGPRRDAAAAGTVSWSLTAAAETGPRPLGNDRWGGGGTGSPPWWKQEPKSDGLVPGRVSPSSDAVGGGGGQQDSGDGAPVSGGKRVVVGGGGGPNSERQTTCRAGYDMTQQPSQQQTPNNTSQSHTSVLSRFAV